MASLVFSSLGRRSSLPFRIRARRKPVALAYNYRGLHVDASASETASETAHSPPDVANKTQLQDTSRSTRRPTAQPSATAADWELTVGVEIHAQLNTPRKLFSRALAGAATAAPNRNVAYFDLALPGAQPQLQHAALLPALRAALALECTVQPVSRWDRKHYFYADQPAGYQITQYHAPLAVDGRVRLRPSDGLPREDGDEAWVGIARVQLEQDTAKTLTDPASGDTLLDFNRAGCALVEIVTRPELHSPAAAAACVRKVQRVLQSVGALAAGMELGGLRADVNVSVRRRPAGVGAPATARPATEPLGQRTEIKNLSSFRAVEGAVAAERDRQVRVLAGGGRVAGETRGWALGGAATRRLRGKEGEVDYRYMPDPDLPPLRLDPAVVEYVRARLPVLPDAQLDGLRAAHGVAERDASILANLDDGSRLEYFLQVTAALAEAGVRGGEASRLAFNWYERSFHFAARGLTRCRIVHELGAHLTATDTTFDANKIPVASMASILRHLSDKRISRDAARKLLAAVYEGDARPVDEIIRAEDLTAPSTASYDYASAIQTLASENPKMAGKVRAGQRGIRQWFVGQLVRRGGKAVDPQTALQAVDKHFDG